MYMPFIRDWEETRAPRGECTSIEVQGEEIMTERFPERLQKLRERRRISRRVLSELCGLSKNSIARYERGERVPNIEAAAILADFFGVTMDSLCLGEKNESEPRLGARTREYVSK